jgi:hypothetical protein
MKKYSFKPRIKLVDILSRVFVFFVNEVVKSKSKK